MQNELEEQKRQARHKITRLLSRREHSKKEIIQKLLLADIDAEVAESVLLQFTEKNLQSDSKYAYSLIRSLANKGKGPMFIMQRLSEQDIDDVNVDHVAQELSIDWFDLARQVREKRFGEVIPAEWTDEQKQKRFLHGRGFTSSQIDEAFK